MMRNNSELGTLPGDVSAEPETRVSRLAAEADALYQRNKDKGLTPEGANLLIRVLHEHLIEREIPYILEQYGPDQTPEEVWQNLVAHSGQLTLFKIHGFENYVWPPGYWAKKLAEYNLGRAN